MKRSMERFTEAREQVEREDDGEAYTGDVREQVLFHVSHLPLS